MFRASCWVNKGGLVVWALVGRWFSTGCGNERQQQNCFVLVDKRCVAWRREWQKRGSEREERGKNVCGDERTVRETSETGLFVARKLVFRSNFLQPSWKVWLLWGAGNYEGVIHLATWMYLYYQPTIFSRYPIFGLQITPTSAATVCQTCLHQCVLSNTACNKERRSECGKSVSCLQKYTCFLHKVYHERHRTTFSTNRRILHSMHEPMWQQNSWNIKICQWETYPFYCQSILSWCYITPIFLYLFCSMAMCIIRRAYVATIMSNNVLMITSKSYLPW